MISVEEPRRRTITITPVTATELQQIIDDIRARYGRKHLIHVIGNQPSGTSVYDAANELRPRRES